MPRRTDLKRILIIGSGPIVIGQAAEFDYSGTQATKALREEGYEVILVNSNPATIMTDPEFADRTYIEPVTPEYVELVIERERPDAILPTMHRGEDRVRALALDHQLHVLRRHRLDVRPVGELRVRHDRGRIGVDEDDLVPLLAQRLRRLRPGVVELGRLPDHDRSRADDQDALEVSASRHGSSR